MEHVEPTFEVLEPILANSQFAITVADTKGLLTIFNVAAEKLTGYSREEVLGSSVTRFYEEEEECFALWERVRLHGKIEGYETNMVHKNGDLVPVSLFLAEIHDERGRVVGSMALSMNQKEKKRLATDLDREKSRVRFYNDVLRHDIRNATQTITGYLQMLVDRKEGQEDGVANKAVEVCLRQARRIRDLIENVGLLERIETRGEKITQSIDIVTLVREVVRLVRDTYSDRNLELEISLPPKEVMVVKSCPLLKDALFNLVDNAVAHNGSSEPWVSVKLQHERGVVASAGEVCDKYRITIEDNGPGIAEGSKELIFQRYIRLCVGGSGLGLSVVKAVVERCDGEVWVEDRVEGSPENGARFVLELFSKPGDANKPMGGRGNES